MNTFQQSWTEPWPQKRRRALGLAMFLTTHVGATRATETLSTGPVLLQGLRTTVAMSYSVKELFYTLQGEGAHAGRPAVFCRFSGCNLWTGREEDRASAICQFCDTDFVGMDGPGGGRFVDAPSLARRAAQLWPEGASSKAKKYVVCTGGEPLLQLDRALVDAFHAEGFEVAIETNGTKPCPEGVDWVCVSPKAGADLVLLEGNELKLVFPQQGAPPEKYEHLRFQHFYLQPMDGLLREKHTQLATQYCLAHPQWHLSLQTHKLIGIP